jgi:hypothetical protein
MMAKTAMPIVSPCRVGLPSDESGAQESSAMYTAPEVLATPKSAANKWMPATPAHLRAACAKPVAAKQEEEAAGRTTNDDWNAKLETTASPMDDADMARREVVQRSNFSGENVPYSSHS